MEQLSPFREAYREYLEYLKTTKAASDPDVEAVDLRPTRWQPGRFGTETAEVGVAACTCLVPLVVPYGDSFGSA